MSQHINLNHEITAHLASKGLHPTPQWLSAFLSTVRPTTAPAAIKQTATFRLLASDITASLARNSSNSNSGSTTFPPNIVDGTIKQRVLPGPLVVQVLDVEDVGRSRWSQVEELEAQARGETTKGREIIRVVDVEGGAQEGLPGQTQTQTQQGGGARAAGAGAGNAGAPGAANRGPHKLLLTDAAGTRAYGFELFSIDGVDTHMSIGAKLVLRNVIVARGMLLLEPKTTTVLGGKVEALHKAWHDGRMERLKAAAKMDERDRSRGS
ncbi:hypothetical protein IWZ03DRAFT_368726 [Phyllosticta citriasiana]|uniref:RecQ-mediated genome instability protein 1 n=1 Tax=Phyllosticta citriasiana TaxID=595635 RepID=A0ABR1KY40_9PEZI